MMLRSAAARQHYAQVDHATRVAQASPHRLIELLFEELQSCMSQAGIALRNRNLAVKSERISKALSIIQGLETSLDFERGGDVARSLSNFYGYARSEIIAASSANDPERLAAIAAAIGEIADAWRQIR